ncbi:unnamed protein product, partial [Sphacelaria rigidula]
MQPATPPAPPSPRQSAEVAPHHLLLDDFTARLTRQRRAVVWATSRQQADQETLNERLAAFEKMRDSIRRDEQRLRQYTAAGATATSALGSLEQEQHLPNLRTTPTASAPVPTSAPTGSAETRQPSCTYAAAAFAVATDVPFADYLREVKFLVSSATGTGRQNGPSNAMCQTYVRN